MRASYTEVEMKFNSKKQRIILIPDSFKGSLSSKEVCQIMADRVRKFLPNFQIISIPIADGGEGTVETFIESVGGSLIYLSVQGPLGKPLDSFYGILEDGRVVIEIAAAAGLPLLKTPSVMEASSYGVGQLISHALSEGKRDFIIGLGGSGTNDGGAGACAALGFKFYDESGKTFIPVGKDLFKINKIDSKNKHPALSEANIVLISDVNNPLCGDGAAKIFGPQKGANEEEIRLLDEGLKHYASLISQDMGVDITKIPGSGAAGGMGGGFYGLLGGRLEMGIEVILEVVKFDELLDETSLVFTGEGKFDSQTLRGKAIAGIAKYTKKHNVPLIAIVGAIDDDINSAYDLGLSAIFSINRAALPYKVARTRTKSDLALTMDEILRVLTL